MTKNFLKLFNQIWFSRSMENCWKRRSKRNWSGYYSLFHVKLPHCVLLTHWLRNLNAVCGSLKHNNSKKSSSFAVIKVLTNRKHSFVQIQKFFEAIINGTGIFTRIHDMITFNLDSFQIDKAANASTTHKPETWNQNYLWY